MIEFVLNSKNKRGTFNISVSESGKPFFMGYPDCNLLKQASAIFKVWAEKGVFPVTYLSCQGFTDLTTEVITKLCSLSDMVAEVFRLIEIEDFDEAQTNLIDLLCTMEYSGFITMFGLRSTIGSQQHPWPEKNLIMGSFEKPHTLPTPEQAAKNMKPSFLTVGARALSKHSHRSTEGFWG